MASQASQVTGITSLKYNNHNMNPSQYGVYASQQQDISNNCEPSKVRFLIFFNTEF